MTEAERFDSYVEPEPNTGCWLWAGSGSGGGYGRFWAGATVSAHRYSYEREKGPIPAGLELDHKCRVRSCVNPDHLEPVTHRENARRGDVGKMRRMRTHCPRAHPYDAANTRVVITKRGGPNRMCRACQRDKIRIKRKAAAR